MTEVGQNVKYRVVKGRGRPAVGKVVRMAGIFIEIQNLRTQEINRINPKMITGKYEFRPYNTKKARG
jgi:hypothetical protein